MKEANQVYVSYEREHPRRFESPWVSRVLHLALFGAHQLANSHLALAVVVGDHNQYEAVPAVVAPAVVAPAVAVPAVVWSVSGTRIFVRTVEVAEL